MAVSQSGLYKGNIQICSLPVRPRERHLYEIRKRILLLHDMVCLDRSFFCVVGFFSSLEDVRKTPNCVHVGRCNHICINRVWVMTC